MYATILLMCLFIGACKDDSDDSNNPDVDIDTGLIVNGDFFSGTNGWQVVNYTSGATSAIVTDGRDSCLKLSHAGSSDWNAVGQEIRSILTPGRTYRVSLKYKVNSPDDEIALRLRFADTGLIWHSSPIADSLEGGFIINDNAWHELNDTFVCTNLLPSSSEPMFAIMFDYQTSGNAYIDDVAIKETTPQITELINNGTFSAGTNGWQIENFTSGASSTILSDGGNSYLMLQHAGNGDWNAIGQSVRSLLVVGNTYRISMKYKVNSPDEDISLRIRFADSGLIWHSSVISQNLDGSFVINDNAWHEVVGTFACTESLPQASEPMFTVMFDYQTSGTVCLDDISLAKISK